jgi:hypothetical protein
LRFADPAEEEPSPEREQRPLMRGTIPVAQLLDANAV